jgi:hypothetical protein
VEEAFSAAAVFDVNTPRSFRRLLYQATLQSDRSHPPLPKPSFHPPPPASDGLDDTISAALCLPVSVVDIAKEADSNGLKFFCLDCRPTVAFNSGHLPTAVHLDPDMVPPQPTRASLTPSTLSFATTPRRSSRL